METADLKQSPLHSQHTALGAKMADFGGWTMPIEYPGGGVVAEHNAVRNSVAVFDVSHLGKATVRGPGAAAFVNDCLSNDLGRIRPGQAQYTMCCAADGGVVDDLIAYLVGPDEVFLIPNAANTTGVVSLLEQTAPEGISVTGQHQEYAVLAVQGPKSTQVLTSLGLPTDHGFMSFADAHWNGGQVRVCRTGYTGETGFELVCAWESASELWEALMLAIEPLGGLPAGLGARDTLRTEMGYPLHGQDLSPEITPVMARAAWAVGWDKPSFWGRAALTAERAAKTTRLSRGVRLTGRGIPRAGCSVLDAQGNAVGVVTSGTFSPSLKEGIALALLDRAITWDDEVLIEVRGRKLPGIVTKPPFVQARTSS